MFYNNDFRVGTLLVLERLSPPLMKTKLEDDFLCFSVGIVNKIVNKIDKFLFCIFGQELELIVINSLVYGYYKAMGETGHHRFWSHPYVLKMNGK